MPALATTWCCFVLLAALFLSEGRFALRIRPSSPSQVGNNKNSINALFSQYNASRYLYQGQPSTADWQHVPWAGDVSSIVHRRSTLGNGGAVFIVGVNDDSEFWWTNRSSSETYPGAEDASTTLFHRLRLPEALVQPPSGGFLPKWTFMPYQDSSSPSSPGGPIFPANLLCQHYNASMSIASVACGVVLWTHSAAAHGIILVVHSAFTVTDVATTSATLRTPLRQMSIEYSLDDTAAERTPMNLYFASQSGLRFVPLNQEEGHHGDQRRAVPVTLTNTTGGTVTTLNVTSVWCFPQWAPVELFNESARPDAFHQGQCYVGSANHHCTRNVCPPNLVHRVLNGSESYFYRTPGIIDRLPNGLAYDAQRNAVHLGNDKCLNVLYANDSLWRVDGQTGGLPMNKIHFVDSATATSETGGGARGVEASIWYGTEEGLEVMKPDGSWGYFYGPRWLPVPPNASPVDGNKITALAAASDDSVIMVATKTGVSIIRKLTWSLAEKAAVFQVQHDVYHNYYGLSTGGHLERWGNVSSFNFTNPSCNSGLWTSIYLHGQAFRYATETDPVLKAAAKVQAKKTFQGMKMLFTVTGIKGYPARTFVRADSNPGGSQWYPSPTMPGFWFWGSTSNDEITGHMSAYPIYHDLVCDTVEEKSEVKQLIANMTSHIVDHDLCLVGEKGTCTHWGHWGPQWQNDDPFFYDSRGLNSLQILMFLSNAYRITGNQTYADVYLNLVNHHGYSENTIGVKVTQESDINFSDDELNFVTYLGMLWSSGRVAIGGANDVNKTGNLGKPSVVKQLFDLTKFDILVSIQRSFNDRRVVGERSSWWNAVYAGYLKVVQPAGLSAQEEWTLMNSRSGALFCLQTWPTSWVEWTTDNSQRLDITKNPATTSTNYGPTMRNIVPYDEITLLLWNGNPYVLQQGNPTQLQDPSGWLTPYWTARFFGLLSSEE